MGKGSEILLKLGIVQMAVLEGKVEDNRRKIRKAVESHAAGDIDLLCFPELCISGYDFESAVLSDREAAIFSELAAEYGIAILAGIHVPEGDKHYDTACIWNEKGELLGEYRKIHLWDTENDFFEKGDEK